MLYTETPLASYRRCVRIAAMALDAGDTGGAIRSLTFAWSHACTDVQRQRLAEALAAIRTVQARQGSA